MKVAFVAGPYRSDTIRGVIENIRCAESVAIELWKMGIVTICPHKNTSLFDGICDDSFFLEGGLEILSRCNLLVLIPSWDKSEGSKEEKQKAELINIPIYYWPNDRDLLNKLKE